MKKKIPNAYDAVKAIPKAGFSTGVEMGEWRQKYQMHLLRENPKIYVMVFWCGYDPNGRFVSLQLQNDGGWKKYRLRCKTYLIPNSK